MATPTLVQQSSTPNTGTSVAATTFKIPLPNKSLSGNCIIAVVQAATIAGQTVTCADDAGNTYSQVVAKPGTAGFNGLWLFTALNIAANATLVTFTLSVATQFISGTVTEWANIATSSATDISGSNENTSAVTAWAGGSQTTATDGDLIYQAAQGNSSIPYNGAAVTAQSGFSLGCTDLAAGLISQYEVQATHAAINPTITVGTSSGYVTVWVALKSAAAGTLPTIVPRVVSVQHSNPVTTATSVPLQFPTSGNLVHCSFITGQSGGGSGRITAISSSPSNTWTQVTGSPLGNGTGGEVQMWYAANASTSNGMTITFTLGSAPAVAGQDFILYDITGANTTQTDTQNTATGTQSVGGNLTTVAVTPTATSELVIFVGDQDTGTITGTAADANSHTALFTMPTWGGQDEGGAGGAGNGFTLDAQSAVFNNADTTAVTAVWTETRAVLAWETLAVVYKVAAGADRDVLIRFGSMDATSGSGLVMAAFATTTTAVAGGGLYPFYYRTLVADD